MSESILVVEYEPRYTDRVRQALAGQPFNASFVKDGEEALRALATDEPRLIVVSSVLPRIGAPELIRNIRSDSRLRTTPILLTISGYSGNAPKADAERVGANDILPKPYSEFDFLSKVHQILGLQQTASFDAPDPAFIVRPSEARPGSGNGLTSDQIFGDLLEEAPVAREQKKPARGNDVDQLLADTLAGVLPQRKTSPAAPKPVAPAAPAGPAAARPRAASGNVALDKLMEDTLSGLERTTRAPRPAAPVAPAASAPPPAPAVAAPAAPVAAPAPPADEELPTMISKQAVVLPAPPPAPPAEEEEPADGVRFGQYVLLEKIATGGMAEVWRARMRGVEGFQKIVAIKKILPHLSDNQDFIEMFIDEAKLAAQLSHNNIVHIFDLGKIQSSYFIAMEYVDGFDLKTILKRAEERDLPMQVELALFIASKVAAALDYAHRKRDFNNNHLGLVHRDVSPQNVLISQEGDIKLCDFGIAKAAFKASHTQTGALKGKLQYMSPEQASGQTLDRRSDVFSLAVVLFEMLTRRKLFSGDSEVSIIDRVRDARVTAPSLFNDEVTPEVDAVVLKALQKDPDQRYQTAAEMARDIDQILYTFKPTPTSADLAIYMHRMSSAATTPPNLHEAATESFAPPLPPPAPPAPVVAPTVAAAASPAPAAAQAPALDHHAVLATPVSAGPARKPPVAAIAAAVLLLAGAGVGWFMMKGRSATTAPTAAAAARPGGQVAAAAQLPAATGTTSPTDSAATAAAPLIDSAKVDEEVRKRLEAARAGLEQQTDARPGQPPPPLQQAAAPIAARPAVVPTAPAPVVETPAPAPQPVAESRPQAPAPAPAPQPSAPETPRASEGDLIPAGTAGLTPARMTRQAVPNYPPLARAQRVEGSVLMNVLVSESGQVLDARLVTGVNRPVGLNEAALQAVRRSSFAPGTKDGVRVKSWTAVRVDFKL